MRGATSLVEQRQDFIKFFKLEKHPILVEKATKPKSCGGTEDFKRLALEGDNILNRALMELFSEIKNTGRQTKLRTEFHSRRTLVMLGKFLGLDRAISAHNPRHQATNNEIKEAVESLLGASHQVNDFAVTKKIVEDLLAIANEKNYMDRNWKGELNELLQKEKEQMPEFDFKNINKSDHQPQWQCTIRVHYKGKPYEFQSETYATKKDAEQEAAFRFLVEIGKVREDDHHGLPQQEEEQVTIEGEVIQAREAGKIIFTKTPNFFNAKERITFSIAKNRDLSTWAREKSKTKAFFLLTQLCVLFEEELQATSWMAKLEQEVLILLEFRLEGKPYFTLGSGPSKTKAQQDAAQRMIKKTALLSWLEQKSKNLR